MYNIGQIGDYFTSVNERRNPTIEAVLERASIDKLPQPCDVLRGDMGLVGSERSMRQASFRAPKHDPSGPSDD